MKKPFVVLAALALVLAGCGVHITSSNSNNWSYADLKAATNLVQTSELPATLKDLEVDNSFGEVRITGTETGPFRWTWKLAVRACTDAAAQAIAASVNCTAETNGGRLRLVVSIPNISEPHSIQSDFAITVPKAVSAHARTRFGRMSIAQLDGDAEAAGQNGAVEIHNIGGHVTAETSFDRLEVSDTGPAVLRNQNGEITAVRIGGKLEAQTSFAPLLAQDIKGAATLANQNGEIKATGIGGALEARTSFDRITARDIGGRAYVRNQNGGVEVAQVKGNADIKTSFARLSVEDIHGDALLANQNGEVEAGGVTGAVTANTAFASLDIKGGGPEFICHNQNGAIRLNSTSISVTNIEAHTSFDSLEVHLPAGIKPALVAHTTFGEVESDFPVLMKPASRNALADADPGALRAVLQNQNGNIRVVRD